MHNPNPSPEIPSPRPRGPFAGTPPGRRSLLLPILLAVAVLLLAATPAGATPGGPPSYPRVMAHTFYTEQLPPEQQERAAWFDMLSTREPPARVAEIRAANEHIRLFYRSMPQFLPNWNEDETFWYADTSYSLIRLCQYYAMQNDWYLYDTSGERVTGWTGYVSNWTRYCPEGTYGTSVGMTYAEWYTDVAIPQITQNCPEWEPWGWGSSAYDGMAWEVFFDCPHCCEPGQYVDADPDRDGVAEGIDSFCWEGGDQDSLSILFRETNLAFRDRLFDVVGDDLVIITNRAGSALSPDWVTDLDGFKIEEWQPHPSPTGHISWWNYMYGQTNWGQPLAYGYEYAERAMNPGAPDERAGWDVTYLEIMTRLDAYEDPEYRQRMIRFGLGTAMLGDGYFTFTEDEHSLLWLPEYDWDFGLPVEDYQRELYSGDTLYVRRFEKGQVEVNPYGMYLSGVPPRASRFSFWLTIENLAGEAVAPDSVSLFWPQPVGEENLVYVSEVRQATFPITAENWDDCELTTGRFVFPEEQGGEIRKGAGGLAPDTQYYFAAKNNVYGRLEPGISNVATVITPPLDEPDTDPPAPIEDLAAGDLAPTSLTLAWTAPGDDADEGTADHYLARQRVGGAIETEAQWAAADPLDAPLPAPAPAGSPEELAVGELAPETTYGFAVRAVDEAGNLGGLPNPLVVTTTSLPPGPIEDLAVTDAYPDGFDLAWTASGDSGTEGRAASYVLGILAGRAIDSLGDWSEAEKRTDGLPEPAEAGTVQQMRLGDLEAERAYGLCLRAYDAYGNLSPLGNSPVATTAEAPDTLPPGRIEDLVADPGIDRVTLAWTAVGDDGLVGTAAAYRFAWTEGGPIETEEDWQLALKAGFDLPPPAPAGTGQSLLVDGLTPETTYGFCLRAVDEAQNLSPLSPPQTVTTLPATAPVDEEPPAAITDLVSSALTDGFLLTWTATGDDGYEGTAASYELAYLEGDAIDSATDWAAATRMTEGLPAPLAPGGQQSFFLTGLADSTVYGLALRVRDEVENLSPLGNAPVDTTLAEPSGGGPDLDPPMMIEDLAAVTVYADGALLQWTTPGDDGDEGTAAFYVLGILEDAALESAADWEAASLRTSGLPDPTPAGGVQWTRVGGLDPGQLYGLCLRAYDDAGNLSPMSPPLAITTEEEGPGPGEDTTPPAPIDDLLASQEYEDGFVLTWTAPGDDGTEGIAEAYALGVLAGRAIETEADWSEAEQVTAGLPPAAPAGLGQAWRLRGLAPETLYGLALRAVDEAGNWSDLGTPLQAVTLPDSGSGPGGGEDLTPPGAILELTLAALNHEWADLTWICSGDDDQSGTAASFVLGIAPGEELATEAQWSAAQKRTDSLPTPAAPGTPVAFRLAGLAPGETVTVAVRAIDDAGHLSPLGASLTLAPPLPPDLTPPGRVTDLAVEARGEEAARLTWTAAGDDGAEGLAATFTIAVRAGGPITSEAEFAAAEQTEHVCEEPGGTTVRYDWEGLPPSQTLGFAVRYQDEVGLLGALSNSPTIQLDPDEPPPPPDELAPAPIADLRVSALGEDQLTLAWTATGDDSTAGRADHYVLGVRPGAPIEPNAWSQAQITELALAPAEAGAAETYTLASLTPGAAYGLALRAADEAGNLSPLSNLLYVQLTTPHEPEPPEAVTDLAVAAEGPGWLELTWTAPASREPPGAVAEVDVRFARVPITAGNWPDLLRAPQQPPVAAPGEPQRCRLGPIRYDERYWVALRTRDALGQWSALSNVASGVTAAEDRVPPPAPSMPGAAVVRGKEDEGIWVTWLAVDAEDIAGYYLYGRRASSLTRERVCEDLIEHCAANEVSPGRMGWPIPPPAGGEQYLISVAAVDETGNESPASEEVALFASRVALEGPYPHPIVVPPGGDPAEFRLVLPPGEGGSVEVELRIYSVSGELVRSRWGGGYPHFAPGATVPLTWDTTNDRGRRVAPGLYFLELTALGETEVRKIYVKRE